jgi:hypothetical protein
MDTQTTPSGVFGVMGEFRDPESLLAAAQRAFADGYRKMDAYTPIPVHGLAEALGYRERRVQIAVLIGGLVGMTAGFSLCYYTSAVEVSWMSAMFSGYALNVGGRPLNSWPAFIIPTFEMTILFAGLTALFSMLAFNRLPMPYHPVFNVARFREHASVDAFFLCIESADPRFDAVGARRFLEESGAVEVSDVEH